MAAAHRRLAHAALAHAEHEGWAVRLDVIDEGAQVGEPLGNHRGRPGTGLGFGRHGGVEERLQRRDADGVEREEGDDRPGQPAQVDEQRCERDLFAGSDRGRERVAVDVARHPAVDDEVGVAHPERQQLGVGAGGLVQRRPLGRG